MRCEDHALILCSQLNEASLLVCSCLQEFDMWFVLFCYVFVQFLIAVKNARKFLIKCIVNDLVAQINNSENTIKQEVFDTCFG